ncbi:hypothetical protein GGI25_000274 [Coemansia spiralis]|uniref:Nucleolar 27S pre-rRNA processing Urb2/Npa2 C-terminal domain-containing protein n=2 Tax=Coemansia TaxID=4863 RepID=A0A9W8GER3_9FUNG|nr:hypothetical protein EDC05_000508 [Coemansia umbellata]KAJ2625846.1 hypothetical protein GGI26_000309 [Coemansia sp. RSA 1358]KAJ2680968.1 hypothetical protein GGI25_000274 [Coemansia spiralis]
MTYNQQLPGMDSVLCKVEIASTEDLTKALRSASLPLQHRLALAWAIFDHGKVGDESGIIKRLSAILVRKEELLAEWLFSTILRELKTDNDSQYTLSKDPVAIDLLGCVLERMKGALAPAVPLDIRAILQGPVLPLFIKAFANGDLSKNIDYINAVTKVWRLIVESAADGLEIVSAKPDLLVQLITLLAAVYLEAVEGHKDQLQESLLEIISSVAHAMRIVCESSLSPRKMFTLFDSKLLLPLFQLTSVTSPHSVIQLKVLDMMHAGLFHVECMVKLNSILASESQETKDNEQNYAQQFFDLISNAMESANNNDRVQYAQAIPALFMRYLQASALICPETRALATNTLGLSAIAATPRAVTQAEASSACFAMFSYFYNHLRPLCADERVLTALNMLVNTYFRDPCFGTASNAGFIGGDVHKNQIIMLDSWLSAVIKPILQNSNANSKSITIALNGIDLALDAGPDSVQKYGDTLLGVFLRVPADAVESATRVLRHWVSTLAKARQLDTLFDRISRLQLGYIVNETKKSLLLDASTLRILNLAVSQSMPYAQVSLCLANLVDAIISKSAAISDSATQTNDSDRKRRRLSRSEKLKSTDEPKSAISVEVMATITANFVLSSVSTANTEHQRTEFGKIIISKYQMLKDALASELFAWERLLLHYVFMEVGLRIDGMERWLESCMYPEHIYRGVLPRCVRKKGRAPEDPRIATMAMLVVFQTAAHWTVFVSSASAGIIPDSIVSATDVGSATATTSRMVYLFVSTSKPGILKPGTDVLQKQTKSKGEMGGWEPWDGQTHSISVSNYNSAQWHLLVDWLELVCNYADGHAMYSIVLQLVLGFVNSDFSENDTKSQALLRSASFFEILQIRDALLPALMEYAVDAWKSQLDSKEKSSKSTRMPQVVFTALELLHASASSKTSTKSSPPQNIIASTITMLTANDVKQKKRLSSNQALVWIRLLRALLCFPTAYWTIEQAHTVFALAFAADLGIAKVCLNSGDAIEIQMLSRTILERLLKHIPSLSSSFISHSTSIVNHWMGSAQSSEKLVLSTRTLLSLVVSFLSQAAFGQQIDAANSACHQLCIHMLKMLEQARSTDISASALLVLNSFGIVARIARQYSQKMQLGSCQPWLLLAKAWECKLSQFVQERLSNISNTGSSDDAYATCCLGVLASLHSILGCLSNDSDALDNSAKLCEHTLGSLKQISQCPGTFGLGLVIIAIYRSTDLETSAPNILSFLVRYLSAKGSLMSGHTHLTSTLRELVVAVSEAEVISVDNLGLLDYISLYVVEPLLNALSPTTFEAMFVAFIKISSQLGKYAASIASKIIIAYVRTGFRQRSSSKNAAQKRKTIQMRLGSTLTALHTVMCINPSVESTTHVLSILNELVLEPTMRFAAYDISEVLGIVFAAVSMPLDIQRSKTTDTTDQLSNLYCLACRILSSVIRYHTDRVLSLISILVKTLRTMVHAFVSPFLPRRFTAAEYVGIDADATSWIIVFSPLSSRCAEAYSRVLDDLVRSRRGATNAENNQRKPELQNDAAGADKDNKYVKLTRGTNAAGAASTISMFAPYILAEYCIIQGGGALTTVVSKPSNRGFEKREQDEHEFYGFSWRPTAVAHASDSSSKILPIHTLNSSVARGIISSTAVREALLPGFHALLDVMTPEDRSSLLTLLVGSSNDLRQGSATAWPSIFGPDQYGGAHEVLKSLYKSYIDFYKYSGQV